MSTNKDENKQINKIENISNTKIKLTGTNPILNKKQNDKDESKINFNRNSMSEFSFKENRLNMGNLKNNKVNLSSNDKLKSNRETYIDKLISSPKSGNYFI